MTIEFNSYEEKMDKTLNNLKKEYNTARFTTRASKVTFQRYRQLLLLLLMHHDFMLTRPVTLSRASIKVAIMIINRLVADQANQPGSLCYLGQ